MIIQLHDNGAAAVQVWPPVQWDDFKPKTPETILNHYYAYSAGCKTPTLWGMIGIAAMSAAAAVFGPSLLAGTTKALAAIKSGAIAKGSAIVGDQAAKMISEEVTKQANRAASQAANQAQNKSRRRLDSAAERNMIIQTGYLNVYAKPWMDAAMRNAGNMTKPQLEALLSTLKKSVSDSYAKCRKLPCDTAGCRSMGALVLRQQYVEALIAAYNSTGTSTPAEFNAKFAAAIDEDETSIKGSVKSSIGGYLPLLLIFGALISKFK